MVEVKTISSTSQTTLANQSRTATHPINQSTQSPHNPQLFLQVGAFHDQSNASQLKQRLLSLTHKEVRIQTQQHTTRPLFLVQIGPLKGVGESDQLLAQLEQAGFREALTIIS